MMLDAVIRRAYERGETFKSADVAKALGYETAAVTRVLAIIQRAGAAERQENGSWRFTCDKADIRDAVVHDTLNAHTGDGLSRAQLDEALAWTGLSSAQIYSSLTRLMLKNRVKKTRDGSRTPLYVAL